MRSLNRKRFDLRSKFLGLEHWTTSVVRLSTEGSLWSTFYLFSSLLAITLPSFKSKTALFSYNLMSGKCEQQFPAAFQLLSRDCSSVLLILFSDIFSCREKLEHDMLNSNIWKIPFHPRSCLLRCSRSNIQI